MKEYKKLMKQLNKDDRFEIKSDGRRNTIKLVHIKSNSLYSVHPGDKAVKPLLSWINKITNEK